MNSICGSEADVPLFTMYIYENQSDRPNWIFVTTQQVKYCLFNAYIIMLQLISPSWSNKKNWKLYVWLFLELRLFILWTVSTVAHENGSVFGRIDLCSLHVCFPNESHENQAGERFHSNFVLSMCICTHNLWKDKGTNFPKTFPSLGKQNIPAIRTV